MPAKKISVSLVVGAGEVGASLATVLKRSYPVYIFDAFKKEYDGRDFPESFDVMHICFPFNKNFVRDVRKYQKRFKPSYTIIHSTVSVGTSARCQAFHSPVRGLHPHLEQGIKTFIKYLAPRSLELAAYFKKAGVKVREVEKPETTEALKLWDTTYYGWNIMFEKLVHAWCVKHSVDFNIAYTDANVTYNEGYKKLGRPQVT